MYWPTAGYPVTQCNIIRLETSPRDIAGFLVRNG